MSNTKKNEPTINRLAVLWHLNGCVVTFYDETPLKQKQQQQQQQQHQKRVPLDTISFTTKAYLAYRHVDLLRIAPPAVPYLESLTCLQLHNNNLKHLPDELWRLMNLKELNVGHNQLEEIPPQLGHLTQLEEIFLHNNQLKRIPTQIGRLTQLRVVDLTHNQLTELPGELFHLEKLRQLWIDDNPFVSYKSTFKDSLLSNNNKNISSQFDSHDLTFNERARATQQNRIMPLKSICMQIIGLLCLNDEKSRDTIENMSSDVLAPDIRSVLLPEDIAIAPVCFVCSSNLFHDSLKEVFFERDHNIPLVFKVCSHSCLSALLEDFRGW